ncbi:serine/threonine protein kinase [Trifolium pratense]|uniref:Serine/threonine protein kinase n=1 Tax=Trifolium pratense TaxID=57577 RepID=A0A2K3P8I5_TRIPR|nr:serine/threonine protein kinase [Trifolium pratense]
MSNEDPGISGYQYRGIVNVGFSDITPSDEDNVCHQTGEEFSSEFLRDRVALRKFPVIPDAEQRLPNILNFNNNNYQLIYEDQNQNHVLGLGRIDSDNNLDFSEIASSRGYVAEADNRAYHNNLSKYQCELGGIRQASRAFSRQSSSRFSDECDQFASGPNSGIRQTSGAFSRQLSSRFSDGCDQVGSGPNTPSIYAVESPRSCHPYGTVFSEGSFFKKIKFLCSFGGRILPRPNDGKLRYVGGETRIISIRKNITHEELTEKTSGICNQTHTIKYQLPGEDLDALISVCSDEDLHHMIEEYEELERAGGSQRLRIFLIPSNEPDSPSSNESRVNQQSDVDYHYVVAVNGILDRSPRKNHGGLSLANHTSQFANTSDYNNPHFHRESSTYAFASEVKDCNPTSSNLGDIMSKPGPFLTSLKVGGKSFNQRHLSGICVQPNDQKNSNVQLFTDQSYNVVNENIIPYGMEKIPRDNSLYVDDTSYADPITYYNNLTQGSPCVNYHPSNQYTLESDQDRKSNVEFKFHRRTNSKEFVSPAICNQTDMIFERPLVNSEGSYHFNNIVSHPHESASVFSVSGDRDVSQYKMLHTLSESTLLENNENYKGHMQFPFNVERDKLSSLETSSSLEECSIQPGEINDGREHMALHQKPPTFGMTGSCKRSSEIGREKLQHANKSVDWLDEKVGSMPQHLQYIYYQQGACSSSPDLQSIECNASAAPFIPSLSTRSIEEQPHGIPLDTLASEFSMRSQNSSMHRQFIVSETKYGHPPPLDSFELRPTNSLLITESVLPISYPDMVYSSLREVVVPDDDLAYYQNQKEENIVNDKQSHEYIDEFCINKPESTTVVTEQIDYISSGIRSCLAKEDKVEHTSLTKAGVVFVNHESESKLAKADSGNFNRPIGDSETSEKESELYGLQIIENGDLEELHELGSGTFGTVYHGKWRGTDVAIKRIKSSCFAGRLSEQERLTKDFWREAKILSTLHHPNVVAFYGIVPDGPGGTLATVTEYMLHGSLRNVLLKKERQASSHIYKVLDRRKRVMIAMDAAFGMEYLHLKNIVHFDLKCDNLLVNLGDPERPVCKVGDFGLSRIKRNTLVSGGVRGTLPWMAPELLDGNSCRVSEKVDIFSFGIAMWEILTGEEPYANMHCGAIIGGIVSNTLRPSIPKRCDSEWKKLMEECWSPDPEARPSFTEVKNRLRSMSAALQKKRPNVRSR